jgi:hypothetical protein
MILKNLLKVFTNKIGLFGIMLGIVLIAIPSYYFLDTQIVIWNKGYNYLYFEIFLDVLIAILFWIFIGATLYKMSYFSVKKTWVWFLWGILWILVSGCPSCTITLASYLWLAGFVSVLPYEWLELKIISVFLLLYVCYTTLKKLETCELKLKK